MKINSKKIISMFLMAGLFCTSFLTSMPANAIGTKSDTKVEAKGKEKVKKTTSTDKLLNETLQKSVAKEEYISGEKVIENEPVSQDERALVIEGSVEKSMDVDLTDCLKLALGNNPRIKIALNDALVSHEKITQAWSNYFPTLGWGTSYSNMRNMQQAAMTGGDTKAFNYYVMGQVTLTQMLYDFGVTQNTVTIKKIDYETSKTSLTSIINDVICQTKNAYYNLLLTYDTRRVAQDTVKKNEMFYNQAKAFYEIGLNPKVDMMIAEVNLGNAKMQLIQAENAIDVAVASLNNTMGVPYMNKYNVQEKLRFNPVKITMADAFELAKESRPELKMADLRIKSADQQIKLANKSFYPKITAQGSYARGGQSFNETYGYNYGVYLNFPTVNGLMVHSQNKEAASLYDKELANAQNTKNNVYLEIQKSFLSLYEKKNQIPVALLQVKQAKESYDMSFGRYRVGEGSPTELKDAQNAYETAQLSYYQALYQYNSAKAGLEKAIGRNIVGENDTSLEIEL